MKTAISFNTVNRDTSGPGAFARAAKWYWDELTDMIAAAGFDAVVLSMIPDSFNNVRCGAPICAGEFRQVYGSAENYLAYLNEKGIKNVEAMMISGQAMLDSMFESGISMANYFAEFHKYAEDVCNVLHILGGPLLLVSPTPAWGNLLQILDGPAALEKFEDDAAACLNKIGAMSQKMGIRTCVKNDFWTLMRGNGIRAFMEKLDRSLVSFAPDTAQLQIADADPVELIDAYGKDLHCICLTDTKYKDQVENYKSISPEFPQSGVLQRCYCDLGYGNVDFEAVYNTLKAHNFDNLVVLESRYTLNVPRAILRMNTFWKRLTNKM